MEHVRPPINESVNNAVYEVIGNSKVNSWPEEGKLALQDHVEGVLLDAGELVNNSWRRLSSYSEGLSRMTFSTSGTPLLSTTALPIKNACPQLKGAEISRGFRHTIDASLALLQYGVSSWEEYKNLRDRQSKFKGSIESSKGRSSSRSHSDPQINPR